MIHPQKTQSNEFILNQDREEQQHATYNYGIHMISYGDDKFKKTKQRIYEQAVNTKWFDTIELFSPHNLTTDFKQKFSNILHLRRGGGYWIWKFDIILTKLKNINDNDILIYLDAGCTINPKGKRRFLEYIQMLRESSFGIISFDMTGLNEAYWTTKQIFESFGINSTLNKSQTINSGQYPSGILIMQKTTHLINILLHCLNVLHNNPKLITDYYNNMDQIDSFRDNRHDQSILSVARKIHGSIIIKDECCSKKCWTAMIPFWATRLRNEKDFLQSV